MKRTIKGDQSTLSHIEEQGHLALQVIVDPLTFTKDGPNSVKAFRRFRARSRVFFWRLPVCRSKTR
jgi:hypothetical protein